MLGQEESGTTSQSETLHHRSITEEHCLGELEEEHRITRSTLNGRTITDPTPTAQVAHTFTNTGLLPQITSLHHAHMISTTVYPNFPLFSIDATPPS